ncbi:type IV pilin protein [Dyella subtropica]|uniref:type IV pilin protein n=1 Tax=Dyella subtropica TaxID=2992127 RepID=UPI002B1CDD21|nr:type IV pilin protein [Dyella subtropica]
MQRLKGFTLIELIVVVAIVAILAMIAIPTYGRYAYRVRRVDGQELLLRIAHAQERYYATYHKYADLKTIGFSEGTTASSEKGYYQASIVVDDTKGQGYTATAIAQGVQAGDACGDLSINQSGVKTPGPADAANSHGPCW